MVQGKMTRASKDFSISRTMKTAGPTKLKLIACSQPELCNALVRLGFEKLAKMEPRAR